MGPAGNAQRSRIAVVGTGIAGLGCAWLLAQGHDVTVYEAEARPGGHSNTVSVQREDGPVSVDTGFIVYNERTYPNLTALFDLLQVPTRDSEMSFAVSLRGGALEYSGSDLKGLFAQPRNLANPRFWSMLRDLARFYREAPRDLADSADCTLTLGDYLAQKGFGAAFRDDHLLPMAAAVWSSPAQLLLDYPAASFVRFCANHGLLQIRDRPVWRTVCGGSKTYVDRLARSLGRGLRLGVGAERIHRHDDGSVTIADSTGGAERFDHVVLATHADQALALLETPSAEERRLLGAFRYSRNRAVLHGDISLMPARRIAWSSWNYIESGGGLCVTYWMNRLQGLDGAPLLVTLNPLREPRADLVERDEVYFHPVFDPAAVAAQRQIWSLQGQGGVWYCGAYFGAGFHEDGLQAGLAVAEQLGGLPRPWLVAEPNGRIHVSQQQARAA